MGGTGASTRLSADWGMRRAAASLGAEDRTRRTAMTRSAQASSAYDEDFFTWTQDRAAALRRAGEHGGIDVAHLAEEIEDLGKRELREVTSFLRPLFLHLIKIAANPEAQSMPHWRSETRAFARSAAEAFSPGMRRLIDLPEFWEEALHALTEDAKDLSLAPPHAQACPSELDDLLSKTIDVDVMLARMGEGRS